MSESAENWNVRFELATGGYTFTVIRHGDGKLSRDEVQEWADAQVRTQDRYRAVDEIYPVQEPGHKNTPEIIYLIPGEDLDGAPAMVWCDDPAPSYADDPDEAVKYYHFNEVERLRARVAELEWACQRYIDVGADSFIEDAMDSLDSQPFILLKQAEAVEGFYLQLFIECPDGSHEDSNAHRKAYSEFFVKRLRNDAEKAGGEL